MPVRGKKIGLLLPQWEGAMAGETARGSDIITHASLAEQTGFDSVWTVDQLLLDLGEYYSFVEAGAGEIEGSTLGCWECWAITSALAVSTSTIEIGTLVTCTAYRNPALLARMADTVDELSGGRLILGLGAGAMQSEFEKFGYAWERRFGRFEEALQVISPLLRGQTTTFEGEFYRTKEAQLVPKGIRPDGPPVLIGTVSGGPRMRRLVAQYADHWNCWIVEDSRFAAYQEAHERIVLACEQFERDPGTLTKSVAVGVCLEGFTPPMGEVMLSGSITEIADQLERFLEADLDHVMISLEPNTRQGIETFSRVMAKLN